MPQRPWKEIRWQGGGWGGGGVSIPGKVGKELLYLTVFELLWLSTRRYLKVHSASHAQDQNQSLGSEFLLCLTQACVTQVQIKRAFLDWTNVLIHLQKPVLCVAFLQRAWFFMHCSALYTFVGLVYFQNSVVRMVASVVLVSSCALLVVL